MEAEILKIICANQGSVGTDDLMFNLYPGDSSTVSQVISNQDKFALCCPNGQPTVVVRTRLRLCRAKDCPGSCRGLHLCQFYLFKGSCGFSLLRRGCNFSHELKSEHNQRVLRDHELESLNLDELRTLLLQSDNTLLPPICYDYNNGYGEFGRCQEGVACKRLHLCENFFKRDCSCYRDHDFNAPQPLRSLQEKGLPDTLFPSLKSAYANKEALRFSGNRGGRSHRGHRGHQHQQNPTGDASNPNVDGSRGRGRGRGGYRGSRGSRGIRGSRGNPTNQPRDTRAASLSDILDNIDTLDLYGADGSSDGEASVTSSEGGRQKEYWNKTPGRGRGGNRGNRGNRGNFKQLPKTRSTSDIFAAANDEAANSDDAPQRRPRPVRDKTEICMFFIKGHCMHEDRCYKAHDKMPYRWQVREGNQWTAMPENESIEKDYCDPNNAYSTTAQVVHFDTMTCGPNRVRRLSTLNSLVEPNYILTTEWLWYWQDEFGKWNLYAGDTGGHRPSDIDSATLEQKFLDNDKDVVEFKAGSQTYSLSFQDMIQTNKHYLTKRVVSRRPRFVSAADVQAKKVRKPPGQANATPVPDNWDKTQIPAKGCSRITLQSTSDEFKEVETLFCRTMRGFDIVSIERIQNKALWEVFQWQKNQMRTNNGGRTVMERKLFHGTDNKYVDAICLNNFDWRVCGVHGTAFGKGSYFARDAKYSHSYTGDTDVKTMFVSRVLVGDYTPGAPDYRRPPSKDGGDINFYDSCVDKVMDPSIFVVFEKHQIYPAYLLQYKTTKPQVDIFGAATGWAANPVPAPYVAPAPKPAPVPKPVPVSKPTPAPRPAYQPSTPVYQRNTVSHPPRTPASSAYQSSTFSYQSSTSSYPRSTSSSLYGSQFSPPSPRPPPPKKESNSCVIA